MTLVSDDGSLEEAHMVIFAAASSFSRRQLKVTNTIGIMLAEYINSCKQNLFSKERYSLPDQDKSESECGGVVLQKSDRTA